MTFPRPCVLVAATAMIACAGPPAARAASLDAAQKKEVRELVRDYILDHPQVVAAALRRLREAGGSRAQAPSHPAADISNAPGDPVLGAKDGDVTLVEFFDYQCGYCKRVARSVMDVVARDGNVRLVMKEFPILGPVSAAAARHALAAVEQGKYQDYHNALMAHRGPLDEAAIVTVAATVGLNVDKLKRDAAKPGIEATIDAAREAARGLGVRGTPSFVIGERVIPGAVDAKTLKAAIAEARAGAKAKG